MCTPASHNTPGACIGAHLWPGALDVGILASTAGRMNFCCKLLILWRPRNLKPSRKALYRHLREDEEVQNPSVCFPSAPARTQGSR